MLVHYVRGDNAISADFLRIQSALHALNNFEEVHSPHIDVDFTQTTLGENQREVWIMSYMYFYGATLLDCCVQTQVKYGGRSLKFI
jgi:hypothetical protein